MLVEIPVKISVYALVLAGTMAACKARDTDPALLKQVGCTVHGEGESTDPIARAARKTCSSNVEQMLLGTGCRNEGTALIGEASLLDDPRKIDVFECPVPEAESGTTQRVFFSHPDEIIAQDERTNLHNFYKIDDNGYELKGNSFSPTNECKGCHVNGALVMKELRIPWKNWIPVGASLDVRASLGNGLDGNARHAMPGITFEDFVLESTGRISKALVEKMGRRTPPFDKMSLRTALKPLFCDTEINLVNDIDTDESGAGLALASLYTPEITGLQWNRSLPLTFRMPIPSDTSLAPAVTRSAFDMKYIKNLVEQAVVEEALAFAASLVDFPNPQFSAARCSILMEIPDLPLAGMADKKQLSETLAAKMKDSSSKSVQEFLNNLRAARDNFQSAKQVAAQRVVAFLDNCAKETSAVRNREAFADLYRAKMIPLLQRSPTPRIFPTMKIIEHFPDRANSPSKAFSDHDGIIGGKYASLDGLGLDESCQLRKLQ